MIAQIIIFLAIALVIIYGAHFCLYITIVRFLDLTRAEARYLAIVLAGLALSLIISMFLNRAFDNQLTEWLYIASSVWYGLFVNLLLAAAAGWVIHLFGSLLNFQINLRSLTIVLCLVAVVFSAYGFYNARSAQIKNVAVKIKNLPPEWAGKTVVQITDVHLGAIYGAAFLTNIVNKINFLDPDMVFITGDLFDGTGPDLAALAAPLKNIKSAHGVYFVSGNHETYIGKDKVAAALKDTGVVYLQNDAREIKGLIVAGADYAESGGTDKSAEFLRSLDPDKPTILLKHAPDKINDIRAARLDLMLSGHTHRGQLFPFSFITRAIFGRFHTGLNTDGDLTIYTSPGTGTWGPPMRTSGRSEITVIRFE